jgi:hypothetical protein
LRWMVRDENDTERKRERGDIVQRMKHVGGLVQHPHHAGSSYVHANPCSA